MIVFISIALVSALMGYIFCLSLSKCTVNKRTQRYLLKKRLTSTKEYLTPRKKTHESVDAHFDQTKVTIGSRSNAALQSLFDVLLKEYIDFWYKPLTSNPDFMIQLKVFLQYACAVIVQRVKNVKFSEFLIHRFIPHFFDHVIHILSLTSSENLAASNVGEMHKKSGTILKEQKQFQKSSLKSCPEEVVLCALSDRLHAALYSRQAEVMYLRAMVNRLLPFLSMPPSLSPDIHKSEGSTVGHSSRLRRNRVMNISPGRLQCSPDIENQSPVTRSVSSGALFLQKLVKLGCNPSSYSFLIEILSTCVLLPAMDILANSDFLNHLILLCFSGNTDPEPLKKHDCEHVPLLEAYIHDWQKWLSKKPSSSLHLETLLSHQDELYPFMQYMKSVKSIGPLTVVLLMHQINSRVSKRILSFDACHEIEAQIRHILSILHDDDTTTTSSSSSWTSPTDFSENYSNSDGESINHKVSTSFTHQKTPSTSISPSNSNSNDLQLYTISTEFEELLEGSLKYCSPETLIHLITTPVWKRTYESVYKAVEFRFLPMYLESPEYIKHSFGFSHSLTTSASSLNRFGLSPKRSLRRLSQNIGGSQQQTSLFGSAFMNVFGSQSVDGQSSGNSDTSRLPISSSRRSQRDRLGNIISEQSNRCNMNSMTSTSSSNATEESFTNQHVSGIKHLPEQSQQIDLSQCTVHIRGLSRPEVTHLNRNALGAIAASAVSPLISSANITTPSSQIIHLPSSMNSSISTCNDVVTNNNNISVSTTAVRDISYRNKISNELNNLIGSSSVVGPQPTVTSSNPLPQLSPQFMFNVVTETVINGVRRQVVKVTRKYSEFYVLEQKLIEFHGSFITKQLPRRQLTPRSMEFLESKCEIFESYLQYLISQPFLRKSKLLYSFLTSNEPFNTNLFELNLGRFVKSVPLKLTKEKGQFLDDFLTSYYLSCHPQPIETDNTFDEHEVTKSKSLSTYPSINSTVGGVNTTFNFLLNSSDHNPRSNKASISSQLTMPKSIFSQFRTDKFVVEHCTDYYSRYVLNSVQYKSQGRTSLDHRLRSRVYWNNAGLTYEKRKDTTNDSSQLSTVHLDGLSEMIFYLFDKIITCSPISSSSSSNQQSWLPSSIETKVSIDATVESKTDSQLSTDINSLDNKLSIDPWDVTNPCWSEAFLNGPPIPIVKDNNNNNNTYETIDYQSVQQPTFISQLSSCNNMKIDNQSTNTSIEGNNNLKLTVPILSISLQDLCLALYELYILIGKQCKMCLRQLLLRIGFILITYFKTPIDNWLTKYLMLYFYNTFSDENFANMLDNIKTNIFFHSTKKVDMDKSERKEKARAALEKAVLDITGISYLTDVEKIREKVNLVFDCFQYSKWNKQLTYALLDQFILELFPELGFNNNDNISRDVRKESSQ